MTAWHDPHDPDLARRMESAGDDTGGKPSMSASRSIHFGTGRKSNRSLPFEPPPSPSQQTAEKTTPNVLQCFADALRDAELVREKLRGIVNSTDRHGDLQIALSAAGRLAESLRSLIAQERV